MQNGPDLICNPAPVSVIIPTFNRREYLQRSINSILKQSLPVKELIVVDDGSDDGSNILVTQIINSYKGPTEIIYLYQENKGVSAARNLGISTASSPWLAFLDSDDEWQKNKIKLQFDYLSANPRIKVIHGEERWYRNHKFVNQKKHHKKYGGRIYNKCLPLCLISPSAVVIHKDVFSAVGLFKEEYPVCEDYDLWLRITSRYNVGFIETPIINKFGGHKDQLSQKYRAMDYWRLQSMIDHLDNTYLNDEERNLTKNLIVTKYQILKQGYLKREKTEEMKVLKALMSQEKTLPLAVEASLLP